MAPVAAEIMAGRPPTKAMVTAINAKIGEAGIFAEANGGGTHGLNERIRVRSLYEGRDFLFDLVKAYTARP